MQKSAITIKWKSAHAIYTTSQYRQDKTGTVFFSVAIADQLHAFFSCPQYSSIGIYSIQQSIVWGGGETKSSAFYSSLSSFTKVKQRTLFNWTMLDNPKGNGSSYFQVNKMVCVVLFPWIPYWARIWSDRERHDWLHKSRPSSFFPYSCLFGIFAFHSVSETELHVSVPLDNHLIHQRHERPRFKA